MHHPSRIQGFQKFLRQKAYEELVKKEKKPDMKQIDMSKGDWTL